MQRTYHLTNIAPTRTDQPIADLLTAAGRRQRFADQAMIQHRGDAANGFWLIESGKVMACRYAADGAVTIYAVLGPGDLFGELACFTDVPRQVDAIADGAAVLIWIDSRRIDLLLESEPQFARWMLRSMASQLRLALDRIEGDRNLSAEARLVRALAEMCRHEGASLSVTQQNLADLIGVSRVTAGQILRRLAGVGLIRLHYGRIVVDNAAALAAKVAESAGTG